jgi:hypothetical protein
MFKKILLLVFIMIDIFDIIHYIIGLVIVGFLGWFLIKIHLYFSKDNINILPLTDKDKLV